MTQSAPGTMLLEVVARVQESRNVLSLRFQVVEGTFQQFVAGQHLPLRLGLTDRPVATYTISSDPADHSGYRISVKLEPAGKGGSRYLHEAAQIGTRIVAERPRGRFVLPGGDRPVVLLTGGVGITPALSMLTELARQPARPVYFIHACRNAQEHGFAAELAAILANAPHITTFTAYSEATDDDLTRGRCQMSGRLGRAQLRRLLPLDHYHVLLCGPDGFMTAMRAALKSLGLTSQDIHQESFGGTLPVAPALPHPPANPARADTGILVRFQKSGLEAVWDGSRSSLLELAEAQGLTPQFECRAGICGTCMCGLAEGSVTYTEELIDSPWDGHVFLCCAVPDGSVTLDL